MSTDRIIPLPIGAPSLRARPLSQTDLSREVSTALALCLHSTGAIPATLVRRIERDRFARVTTKLSEVHFQMLTLRRKLPAFVSLSLMLCFLALSLPPATVQAGSKSKKTTIPFGLGKLVIKRRDATSFTFNLTDPQNVSLTLAKGSVEATENSLAFQMSDSDGRTTLISAKRTSDHELTFHLESSGIATDVGIEHPPLSSTGNKSGDKREYKPVVQPDHYRAYVQSAAQSRGLRALASVLEIGREPRKEGGNATLLARLVRIATGSTAAANGAVTSNDSIDSCGDLTVLNMNLCMIEIENPVACWWDSVMFFVACIL